MTPTDARDDLVERARTLGKYLPEQATIFAELATRIEQLTARIAELEAERGAFEHRADQGFEAVQELGKRLHAAEAQAERLREALTPSGDTKTAYIGEFHFSQAIYDAGGNERNIKVAVPWTTVKEIMAAIRARAALNAKP